MHRPRFQLALTASLLAVVFSAGCPLPAIVVGDINKLVEGRQERRHVAKMCGNGVCDTHLHETCASCPADCGRCAKADPELYALSPESGPASRWVSVFGVHLGGVQRVWLVHPKQGRTPLRHRRQGTALQVHIPAGSQGGVLQVQVRGRVQVTKLRYTVR